MTPKSTYYASGRGRCADCGAPCNRYRARCYPCGVVYRESRRPGLGFFSERDYSTMYKADRRERERLDEIERSYDPGNPARSEISLGSRSTSLAGSARLDRPPAPGGGPPRSAGARESTQQPVGGRT